MPQRCPLALKLVLVAALSHSHKLTMMPSGAEGNLCFSRSRPSKQEPPGNRLPSTFGFTFGFKVHVGPPPFANPLGLMHTLRALFDGFSIRESTLSDCCRTDIGVE